MNYLERSLERSGELWRAQEEALSRSLASAYVRASATEEDAAQDAASGAARQVPLPRGEAADESGEGAESDSAGGVGDAAGERIRIADVAARAGGAEPPEAEAYRRRLAEKLLGGAGGDTGAPPLWRVQEEQAKTPAPFAEGSGAAWLARALHVGDISGLAAAGETGGAAVREVVREVQDAQALSRGLERDARRYDGGFLLY